MSVIILLITQEAIGIALLNSAKLTFDKIPETIKAIAVHREINPDIVVDTLKHELDKYNDVLILTDMCGTTPNNIALELQEIMQPKIVSIVAGVNLPMLYRVINYHELPLEALVDKAVAGGREGVMIF